MSLVQMSVSASVLILAIAIIRPLLIGKLPKRIFVVLWGVVLLRLLIPFAIPVDSFAEMPLPVIAVNESVQGAAQFPVLAVVWIAGMVIIAAGILITHLRCRREYATSLPVEYDFIRTWLAEQKLRRPLRIRMSDRIKAPLTYGIWKPTILFPAATDWQNTVNLKHILTHEMAHIRHFDILTKWLLAAALCLHWFNPLVWVMYFLANRDIEHACDDAVVQTFGIAMKSTYAMTLLDLEEDKRLLSPMCCSFAKKPIEKRIHMIMKTTKTTLWGIVLAVVLLMGAGTVVAATSVPIRIIYGCCAECTCCPIYCNYHTGCVGSGTR